MSKLIAIHSFRGGTGKSNVTANLAAAIALMGYRVGIVDTDIPSPGIHALFGFDEDKVKHSLNDYLWGRCSIKQAAYDISTILKPHSMAVNRQGRIYFVPASLNVSEIARISREGYSVSLLNDGFQELISGLQLDYLFIDTHPGIHEATMLSLAISDVLIILLRPDRQDFQGTSVAVEIAHRLQVPELFLVVNRALETYDAKVLQQTLEATYHIPVAGILPNSDEVMRLASSDVFCLRHPKHEFSQVIRSIAKRLTKEGLGTREKVLRIESCLPQSSKIHRVGSRE
jgi:MinD-like ATPase involved in chromosome partitioning or flagellar assembly